MGFCSLPTLFLGHPLKNLRHQPSPGRCLPNTGTLSRTWFWRDTFHRERPSMRSGEGTRPAQRWASGRLCFPPQAPPLLPLHRDHAVL